MSQHTIELIGGAWDGATLKVPYQSGVVICPDQHRPIYLPPDEPYTGEGYSPDSPSDVLRGKWRWQRSLVNG